MSNKTKKEKICNDNVQLIPGLKREKKILKEGGGGENQEIENDLLIKRNKLISLYKHIFYFITA